MTIAQQLKQKGIEEDMEKGRKEEALKIARTMLQKGLDCNTVREITGYPRKSWCKYSLKNALQRYVFAALWMVLRQLMGHCLRRNDCATMLNNRAGRQVAALRCL